MSTSLEQELSDTGLYQVLAPNGELKAGERCQVEPQKLLAMFREMKRIRQLEARMVLLQRQGRIGFFGGCAGQEAVPIATAFASDPGDWIFPALRESSIMLARGFSMENYLAQVFGNSKDVLKGRQMPSHMSGRQVNQVSWSSCIGPQIPHAVGAAWAAKQKGDSMVALGFLGDGASSQPDFHNAMNFAAVFKVPCVIVCQNNHWSISVPTERQSASKTIAIKARAYGMPGYRVDGNDILATRRVLEFAIERARSGGGPAFVECLTYRVGAHSTSDDPTRYRSQAEVDSWAKKDPLARFETYLRGHGILTDQWMDATTAKLDAELSAALKVVEHADPPARHELFDDVYAELPWHLREQRAELLAGEKAPSAH